MTEGLDLARRVPLFAGLSHDDLTQIVRLVRRTVVEGRWRGRRFPSRINNHLTRLINQAHIHTTLRRA